VHEADHVHREGRAGDHRGTAVGQLKNVAERAGRAQDKDDGGGLETLRRDGYM
jgi:hypothetical protein